VTRAPLSTPAARRVLREQVRDECRNVSGVYRMLGPTGIVLYVGQSHRLRTRLLSYFRARGRRNKAARILRHTFTLEWEYVATPFGALVRELHLIKQHRPHFNAVHVSDDWPRAYIALTSAPVEGLRVVPHSDHAHAQLFGPFRRVSRVREAVRALADATGLRDCVPEDGGAVRRVSFAYADSANAPAQQSRAAGCLRYALGSCAGPCIAASSRAAYASAASRVLEFLEGRDDAAIVSTRQAMEAAAESLAFERAAALKGRLERLGWLWGRLTRFRANMDRLSFRYRAVGRDGDARVYLIRRGTVRADLADPTSAEEHAQLEALAARIFSGDDPTGAEVPVHDLDEFYLVASWFRRHPDELLHTSAPLVVKNPSRPLTAQR
jgi:excinuclease UvrABC nuclease subunit